MIVGLFFLALVITVAGTNKKNDAGASESSLEFERSDALIVFGCFVSSVVFQVFLPKVPLLSGRMPLVALILGGFYLCLLIIVNMNREKKIQREHEQILKVFQSLVDIFGQVLPEDVDFSAIPFKFEEDPKVHVINQIVVDTSVPGLKINDNSIIYAQYSLNKYFPEFQWTSEHDAPNRQLIYKGLPKPPKLAKWVGSDYRPSGWIPVGLAGGNAEICLNIADQKDPGFSMYIDEDGRQAETLKMPSAPQTMVLGSTGGGKAVWLGQIVEVINRE